MSFHFRRAALATIAVTAVIAVPANAEPPSAELPKPLAASKPSSKLLRAFQPPQGAPRPKTSVGAWSS
jgi:hypothetical protein